MAGHTVKGKLQVGSYQDPPKPLKDPKNGTPPNGSITTLGNQGDYEEVPFFGSCRGSGLSGFKA